MLARGSLCGISPSDVMRADPIELDVLRDVINKGHELKIEYIDYLANRTIHELGESFKRRGPRRG